MRARELMWRVSPEPVLQARRLVAEAVALDERFADAIAPLPFTYIFDHVNGWSTHADTGLDTAADLVERSIAVDPTRSYAHLVMSSVHLWRRRHHEALAAETRCRALKPNFRHSFAQRGFILHYAGRSAEAIVDPE